MRGSKCYIYDKHRRSKFAPKAHKGFLLGYGANSHTCRVFNRSSGKVEEIVDVKFNETNGSQVEQLPIDIGAEEPSEAIKDRAIGEIKPVEVKDITSSIQAEPSTSHQGENQANGEASSSANNEEEEHQEAQAQAPPQDDNEEKDEEPQVEKTKLPRVKRRVKKDHPVDQILTEIKEGGTSGSKTHLAIFCDHYYFLLSVETLRVEDALEDVDWVNAMHEELHNFQRKDV